jgi:uncharacterized protein YwgA
VKNRDFVLLVIDLLGGQVQGRTKMQKLIYFAGLLTMREKQLGYSPAFYGPYSSEVQRALEQLESAGALTSRVLHTGRPGDSGFEMVRYDYELSDFGKRLAIQLREANEYSALAKKLESNANKLKAALNLDYVTLSVAAKTYYIVSESGEPTRLADIQTQASDLEWQLQHDEITQVADFLQRIGLVRQSEEQD